VTFGCPCLMIARLTHAEPRRQCVLANAWPEGLLLPSLGQWRLRRSKGSLAGLVLETDDVDATFESVRATGAEVLQEPMDQPYGTRDCAFRDPAGNQVRINQRPKS
jgi:uncharacterized glyoxalase superfamily protein PhnB